MHQQGYTLEEARSWTTLGCLAPHPALHWGAIRRNFWKVFPAKLLELALNDGADPVPYKGKIHQVGLQTGDAAKFTSFEQVFEAFRKQMEWACRKSTHIRTLAEYCNNTYVKRPFASCLFHRSLDTCRDVMDCPDKSLPLINMPGRVNAIDSLISLKKVVFEDKKYNMEEVLKALRANWEGYEEMRRDFINAPKYGNDDDFADEVAKQVFTMYADEVDKVKGISGFSRMQNVLVVTWMFSLAPVTGALPNGRKLGDWLADGGVNPLAGYARNGPMAAVLSASKSIDYERFSGNVFNQRLSPPSVAGEAGLRKLQNYIETAMHLGLALIQFNIADSAMLREAQKHPEQYQDLVVRVAGYNARFVHLPKFVQDSVIGRTEHALA